MQADRKKNELKVKLQMARFLQGTVEEMAVSGRKNKREAVQEFAQFFEKVCHGQKWLDCLLCGRYFHHSDQSKWTTGLHQ